MARGKPLTVRGFFPDGNGGYVPFDEVPEEEIREWRERMNERVAKAVNDYYSCHIEEFLRLPDKLI